MIRPLCFIDVQPMLPVLLSKQVKEQWNEIVPGLCEISLRAEEEGDSPRLRDWRGAMNVLNKVRAACVQINEGKAVKFGRVVLQRLGPGVLIPWRKDDDALHHHLHLTVLPSSASITYSADGALPLAYGALAWVDQLTWHSAANHGQGDWVRLLIDVRKPEIADDVQPED